jgi:hypothetical protein
MLDGCICQDVLGGTLGDHLTLVNNVGALTNVEGLSDVMICDQDADAPGGET